MAAQVVKAVKSKLPSISVAHHHLPPMPTIRDVVKLYRLNAIKQLSQNFLMDEKLTHKIVKAAGRVDENHVCEVGPGPGGITRAILARGAKKVILIEKDLRFKSILNMLSQAAPGRVETYYGDVLSFNMSNLFPEEERRDWDAPTPYLQIMGNLPFNVATPLIIRWLKDISEKTNAWRYGRVPLTLTFQKEVAERLAAEDSHEQRCRLSIMAQYLCQTYHKFTIKGSAFVPKPDVDVGVVKFIPRKTPLINQPFDLVEKVTRQLFSMRQKHCWKGLSTLFPETLRTELVDTLMTESGVDRTARPYELTIEQVGRLCDAYAVICENNPVRDYNYRGIKPDEAWEELHGTKQLDEDEIVEDLDKKDGGHLGSSHLEFIK